MIRLRMICLRMIRLGMIRSIEYSALNFNKIKFYSSLTSYSPLIKFGDLDKQIVQKYN